MGHCGRCREHVQRRKAWLALYELEERPSKERWAEHSGLSNLAVRDFNHFSFHKTVMLKGFTVTHSLSQAGLAEIKSRTQSRIGQMKAYGDSPTSSDSLLLTSVWFLHLRK